MRTLLIVIGGLILWGVCLGAARLLSGAASATAATKVFIALWLVIAAGNMWIGVSRAGYSVAEELPIFLLIFLLPSAIAWFLKTRFF